MWFSSWLIHLCVRLSWSPCMYAAVVAHPATQSLCLTHANNIMTLIGEWALPVRLNEAHAHTNPIKLEASVHWGAQSKNLKASTRASSAHQVNKYLILRQPCVSSCSVLGKLKRVFTFKHGATRAASVNTLLLRWFLFLIIINSKRSSCSSPPLSRDCHTLLALQYLVPVFPASSSFLSSFSHVHALPPRLRELSPTASRWLWRHCSPGTEW